ncbi:MAG: tetratricopeptide (TPR) repeat protein [Planctomycetota bacterium]
MIRSPFTFVVVLVATLILPLVVAAQSEEEIDKWYERAEKFSRRGQWRRASNFYSKITSAEKEVDAETFAAYYLSLLGSGSYQNVDTFTAKMLSEKPNDRLWVMRRIDVLREVGRDDEALTLAMNFSKSVDSNDMEVLSVVGQIHLDHGRDGEAQKIFDDLIERAKKSIINSASDLTGLGTAYSFYPHGGKAAEEALVSAQKADKKYLPAYQQLGVVYGTIKVRPTDMNREYKDALEIRPRWAKFMAGQIRSCDLRLGQGENEKRALVAAILKSNPRYPEALYYLGMRELSDANWKKSEATFKKALATNPNHKLALSGLAALMFVTHKTTEWKSLENKILTLDPTYASLYRIIATGLSERRRWDESQSMMKKAVALDAKDSDLWDDLARYSLYIGDEGTGVEALKKAYDLATYNRVWRSNMMDVMKLLDKKYTTNKTEHFVIKLHEDDTELLKHVVPAFFERSWDEFVERYGFEPKVPVIIDAFRRQVDFSVRTMGTSGLGALGVSFGPTVMMFIPRNSQRPVNWASTAHHELAHVFTLQASRGRVPRWLTEGLSTWEEVRRNPSWGRNMEIQLHDAYHNNKILPVLKFDAAFYGPRIIFAYYQGGLASQFIEEKWGIQAIRKMLALYGDDKLTTEVIPEALGVSPQEFDTQFLTFVEKMLKPLKRMPTYDADTVRRAQAAIAADNDVQENQLKIAWGNFRAGKFIDADAALKPLVDANVEDDRITLLLAHRAYRGNRRDVAKKHYESLLAKGFEDYDMSIRMAAMLEKENKDGEAFELWKKAKKQNPWSIDPKRSPYIVLARRYRAEGKLNEWAKELSSYCALVDIAVEPRLELVEYYLAQERKDEAIKLLKQCIDVKTFDASLRQQLADIYLSEDRNEEGLVELECVLSLKPEAAKEFLARISMGRLLLKLDRRDDASYHLSRALELKPTDAEAMRLLKEAERDEK